MNMWEKRDFLYLQRNNTEEGPEILILGYGRTVNMEKNSVKSRWFQLMVVHMSKCWETDESCFIYHYVAVVNGSVISVLAMLVLLF